MNNLTCPRCALSHSKKNGHTHYGKQNYQCLECERQYVAASGHNDEATWELVRKLLLECLSLHGICRVLDGSLQWLLPFIVQLYEALPNHLHVQPDCPRRNITLLRLTAEADELWRFVRQKTNKQWVWLAFDLQSRQVLAFYAGDHSGKSARKLWNRIPLEYRAHATFATDD